MLILAFISMVLLWCYSFLVSFIFIKLQILNNILSFEKEKEEIFYWKICYIKFENKNISNFPFIKINRPLDV